MPPHVVNQDRIKSFPTEAAFEEWLAAHHATQKEVWIRIYKTGSGVPTITPVQATDVALCWGWIDGVRKSLDETSFLQRYTPRRPTSAWTQINRDNVARLSSAGRMTPHGLRHLNLAMADGRLDRAAAPRRDAFETLIPADLRVAIDADPRARETFKRLSHPNIVELAARTNGVRTASGRAKKIADLVALLAAGGTLVPEPVPERAAPEGMLPLPAPAPPKRPAAAVSAKPHKTEVAASRQRPTVAKAKPAKRQAATPKPPAPAKAKPAKREAAKAKPAKREAAKAKPARRQAATPKRPAPAKAKPARRQAATPKRPAPAKAKPAKREAAKAKPARRQAATKRPAPAKAKPAKREAATPKRPARELQAARKTRK